MPIGSGRVLIDATADDRFRPIVDIGVQTLTDFWPGMPVS